MEVIRWLCKEPRDHLRSSPFFVHTHNLVAGLLMVLQMRSAGFNAEFRPFGHDLAKILAHNEPENGHADEEAASKLSPRRWLGWAKQWWPRRKAARSSCIVDERIDPALKGSTNAAACGIAWDSRFAVTRHGSPTPRIAIVNRRSGMYLENQSRIGPIGSADRDHFSRQEGSR